MKSAVCCLKSVSSSSATLSTAATKAELIATCEESRLVVLSHLLTHHQLGQDEEPTQVSEHQ